ncbi:MAG: dockerin type I repeat-containing protein [Gammaproteobacteria bacterium]
MLIRQRRGLGRLSWYSLVLIAWASHAAPPQVMLTLSRDEHYFHEAYDDLSDYDGDGVAEGTYVDAIDYEGYFHPHLCYDYDDADRRFEPTGRTDADHHRHYCTGDQAARFSGNFLNWATMTRLDLLRRALYGGLRSTDTTSLTVLERAALPSDGHSFAKYYNGADLATLTPFDTVRTDQTNGGNANGFDNGDEGITLCNTSYDASTAFSQTSTAPPTLRVVSGNRRLWDATERWQCTWESERGDNSNGNPPAESGIEAVSSDPPNSLRLLTSGGSAERIVRVVACDPALFDAADDLEHCRAYPAGNRKPAGVLQIQGESGAVHFGLLTGSWARNRSGGTLRKNVGSMANEIAVNADGAFVAPANGGIIAFLDRLRVWGYQYQDGTYFPFSDNCSYQVAPPAEGLCAAWGNPVTEMYFESLRYLAGDGSPLFAAADAAYFPGLPNVGWANAPAPQDPPASLHIVLVNGSAPSFDGDQVDAARFGVSSLEDLAGHAHQHDLRADLPGEQRVTTWVLEFDRRRGDITVPMGPAGSQPRVRVTPEHRLLFNNSRGALLRMLAASPHREVDAADRASPGLPNTSPDGLADIDANGVPTVNFPLAKLGSGIFHAKYALYFDDTAQGADYDHDLWGTLDYVVNTNTVPFLITVTTKTVTHSTVNGQLFGFDIRGTTKDGFHAYSGIYGANFVDPSGVPGCSNCRALSEVGGQRGRQAFAFTLSNNTASPPSPLEATAQWGGFVDSDGDGSPNLAREWDRFLADGSRAPLVGGEPQGDGVPDNYFGLDNPGHLRAALDTTLSRILHPPVFTDGDQDDVYDDLDNCPTAANADQRDSNGDGHGNFCDADLNNDGFVNLVDLARLKTVFGSTDADADLNGDGRVTIADLARFKQLFGKPP